MSQGSKNSFTLFADIKPIFHTILELKCWLVCSSRFQKVPRDKARHGASLGRYADCSQQKNEIRVRF